MTKIGVSAICSVCSRAPRPKTAGGWVWRYHAESRSTPSITVEWDLPSGLPKAVDQYSLEGKLVATHPSMGKAAKAVGLSVGCVCVACSGSHAHQGGSFVWYLHTETQSAPTIIVRLVPRLEPKPVDQYSPKGKFVATYPSMSKAAKAAGLAVSHVSIACSGSYGHHRAGSFIWRLHLETEGAPQISV